MIADDKRVRVLADELSRVRREFEAALGAVPEAKRHVAPVGQWTAAQIIWHLAKVERGVARLIEAKMATIPAMATVPPGPASDVVLTLLDRFDFKDRSRKLSAPEGLAPPAEVDLVAESLRWADGRSQLLAAAREAGPRLALIRHDHPFLGAFDGFQWVLMVARHEERHLLQLREVVAATQ